MLSMRAPSPASRQATRGSAAASPQTVAGLPAMAAARSTWCTARSTAGCSTGVIVNQRQRVTICRQNELRQIIGADADEIRCGEDLVDDKHRCRCLNQGTDGWQPGDALRVCDLAYDGYCLLQISGSQHHRQHDAHVKVSGYVQHRTDLGAQQFLFAYSGMNAPWRCCETEQKAFKHNRRVNPVPIRRALEACAWINPSVSYGALEMKKKSMK